MSVDDDEGPRYVVLPYYDRGRPYAVVDRVKDVVMSAHRNEAEADRRADELNRRAP